MDLSTGSYNHIEDVLVQLHTECWFTWSDHNNKVYNNLQLTPKIYDLATDSMIANPYSKPTKKFLEDKLVELEAARKTKIKADEDNQKSAKAKLEALSLTTDEVKAAFGI